MDVGQVPLAPRFALRVPRLNWLREMDSHHRLRFQRAPSCRLLHPAVRCAQIADDQWPIADARHIGSGADLNSRAKSRSLAIAPKALVEPEVVATSPSPVKSRVPVCCGFDSTRCARIADGQSPIAELGRERIGYLQLVIGFCTEGAGARGRIRTCTGDVLNVVPLLLGYASWKKPRMTNGEDRRIRARQVASLDPWSLGIRKGPLRPVSSTGSCLRAEGRLIYFALGVAEI